MYRSALPVATADHADINKVTDNRHDRCASRCLRPEHNRMVESRDLDTINRRSGYGTANTIDQVLNASWDTQFKFSKFPSTMIKAFILFSCYNENKIQLMLFLLPNIPCVQRVLYQIIVILTVYLLNIKMFNTVNIKCFTVNS